MFEILTQPFVLSGPVNISTTAVLVSPGLAVKGTMSITASEVYFEVDEDSPEYKKLEPQVSTHLTFLFIKSFLIVEFVTIQPFTNTDMGNNLGRGTIYE